MPKVTIREKLSIYYESTGNGTPIVFIPPPGMGQIVFKYQKELASQLQVITFDIRGQGQSGNLDESITIPLLAEDLKLLLDTIGIRKAIICGYSAGGSIALHFAITYPERVHSLVLAGGYPEVSTLILEKEYKIGMKLVRTKPALLAKILAKAHRNNKEDEKLLYNYMLKNNPEAWHDNYQESLHYRCTEELHKIKNIPVLLLYGQFSAYLKGYRRLFFQHLENVKYVTIPLAFHQLPFKKYKQFNKKLSDYIQSLNL